MVNKFLDAITVALHKVFGNDYHYYVEDIEQNLKLPCFTVDVLEPLQRSVNSYQYYRTMPCVVHAFTANKESTKHDLYSLGDKVLEALEYITIENRLVRGENMSYQLVEGDVLQVFITYRFWTETPQNKPAYMEDLKELFEFSPKN